MDSQSYSKFQSKLLEIARATIDFGVYKKAYHVSFLVRGKRIESIGVNSPRKTHSLSKSFGQYTHSEVHSIVKYRGWVSDIPKCDLYNVRVDKHNVVCNSRPCLSCQKVIEAFGVRRVYYTNDQGGFEEF